MDARNQAALREGMQKMRTRIATELHQRCRERNSAQEATQARTGGELSSTGPENEDRGALESNFRRTLKGGKSTRKGGRQKEVGKAP